MALPKALRRDDGTALLQNIVRFARRRTPRLQPVLWSRRRHFRVPAAGGFASSATLRCGAARAPPAGGVPRGLLHQPCGPWIVQVPRNLTGVGAGFLSPGCHIINNWALLYAAEFRSTLESSGVKPIQVPTKSPNLYEYAERHSRSVPRPLPIAARP